MDAKGFDELAAANPHSGVVISADSVSVAAAYAIRVTRDVLGQGMQTSLRAYRFARAEKER